LIAPTGTEILAMADGKVIQGPYGFYSGTYALEVEHANGMVVRYGEIGLRVPAGIKAGTRVSRGQVIAYVGQLESGSHMLHLEMYDGSGEGPLTERGNNSYSRRSDLVDPTPYLDAAHLLGAAPVSDVSKEDKDASGVPYRQGRVSAQVTSTLKVRGEASTASVILAKLAPGATCKIVEDVAGDSYPPNNSTKWYKVKLEGREGFVAADFIDVITPGSKPPQAPSSVSGRVNHRVTNKVRVTREPSVSAPLIIELAPGAVFNVLEEVQGEAYDFGRTDWCKIESQGEQGYVAAYYVDIQSTPKPSNRWDRALPRVPTDGASAATASQDHLPEGVQSSRHMAQTDLGRIKAIADRFVTAASKFGVPAAVLAAIASRESRCGAVLDSQGLGDNGNGFGIMQVDKRFHDLKGTSNPASLGHLEQATGIFAQNLEDVQKNHPDWEDPYILKGAAVAYNAGVKTVQTKDGMDIGTTGNDYGSDVMARAQYYANHAELSIFKIES
jgi:SH3-like domain-containing protein